MLLPNKPCFEGRIFLASSDFFVSTHKWQFATICRLVSVKCDVCGILCASNESLAKHKLRNHTGQVTWNLGRLQGVATGALSPLNFKSCTSGVFLGVWVLFKWVLEPLPPSRNPTKLTIILFVIRSSIVNITLCLYIALVSLGHSLNTLPDWSGIISSVIERTWKRTVINIEQILSCHLCYFGQTNQLTYVLPVLPRLEWLL